MTDPTDPTDNIDLTRDVIEPVPATGPDPLWIPDDTADRELATALRPWVHQFHVGGNARAAAAAGKWLRARAL